MKKYLLLSAALYIGFQVNSFGQRQDICRNLYVWPFTDAAGQKTLESKMLTDEVEEVLTQISGCLVLQRRNFASLTAQVENERAIQSLENLPVSIDEGLNTIRAETVLFGTVNQDFTGNISLQVSFQSLNSKRILLQNSIFLMGQEAQNVYNRREKIRQFILACINPDDFDEQRDWDETQRIDTRDAYEAFLQKHPGGKYRSTAEKTIADENAWNSILNEIRPEDRIRLLEDYRNRLFRRYANQANDMLGRLLWENGKYGKYLKLFPEGSFAAASREKLDQREGRIQGVLEEAVNVAEIIAENTNGKSEPSQRHTVTFIVGSTVERILVAGQTPTLTSLSSRQKEAKIDLEEGTHEITVYGKDGLKCLKKFSVSQDMTIKGPCNILEDANPHQMYVLTLIVGSKVARVEVAGRTLSLRRRSDGWQVGTIELVSGNHELKVFRDGEMICKKTVKVTKSWTVKAPCSSYSGSFIGY